MKKTAVIYLKDGRVVTKVFKNLGIQLPSPYSRFLRWLNDLKFVELDDNEFVPVAQIDKIKLIDGDFDE